MRRDNEKHAGFEGQHYTIYMDGTRLFSKLQFYLKITELEPQSPT